ncbi:MAG: L-2-hydroxyglutarate oxidase [Magnetococcales bacterium]|nr:L-2-hydroxyglutarate oxidase [Magnetococcales bacterium]
MRGSTLKADFLVIGAGIVGLTLARELSHRYPEAKIVILEKEASFGLHASGRNSGVLHSGIYYNEESLKFKICAQGSKKMAEYCKKNSLPIKRIGKVVIATNSTSKEQLDIFLNRAEQLKIRAYSTNTETLHNIEPHVASKPAIHLPDVAVIDAKAIVGFLCDELKKNSNISFLMERKITTIDTDKSIVNTVDEVIEYGFLLNAAGANVDRIAHLCKVGEEYRMLPFRGSYYKLAPDSGITVNGLIYPVPDLRMPFLGIHFTRGIDGSVYVGPSAIPAMGREHYQGLKGMEYRESFRLLADLTRLYIDNGQGVRHHVGREITQLFKKGFATAAASMIPKLRPQHLIASSKVGIRPQLYNRKTNSLEMDFKVLTGTRSLHILNSISPAFTSAFSFANWTVGKIKL